MALSYCTALLVPGPSSHARGDFPATVLLLTHIQGDAALLRPLHLLPKYLKKLPVQWASMEISGWRGICSESGEQLHIRCQTTVNQSISNWGCWGWSSGVEQDFSSLDYQGWPLTSQPPCFTSSWSLFYYVLDISLALSSPRPPVCPQKADIFLPFKKILKIVVIYIFHDYITHTHTCHRIYHYHF